MVERALYRSGSFGLTLLMTPAGVLVRTLPGAVHAAGPSGSMAFLPGAGLGACEDARARAPDRRFVDLGRVFDGGWPRGRDDLDHLDDHLGAKVRRGTHARTMGVPARLHFCRQDRGREMAIAIPLCVVFPATLHRGTSSDWGNKSRRRASKEPPPDKRRKPSRAKEHGRRCNWGRGNPRVVSGDLMWTCHTQVTGPRRAFRSSRLVYQWPTPLEVETLDANQPIALTAHDWIGSSLAA